MVRFSYKRLEKMPDEKLASICYGVWKGKRVDHKTKRHACSVRGRRERDKG